MIILTERSTNEDIEKVFTLGVGDIFQVNDDYPGEWATIIRKIFELAEKSYPQWEVSVIKVGTELYAKHGSNKLIVTKA